jgi:hypothetical protein
MAAAYELDNAAESTADAAPETIEATLNYMLDGVGVSPDPRRVTLHNARPRAKDFTLERDGFRLVRHHTAVADFYDEDEIRRVYYPEVEALIKAESGAARAKAFNHILRAADEEVRKATHSLPVARFIHNDFTEFSGPEVVRELYADEADELLERRFAIIQVWQPILYPVETFPLAVAEAQSLSHDDLLKWQKTLPNRVIYAYHVAYNPAHRWHWFPRMRREEALVFKTYDSSRDGRARWTAHTAFEDPTTPPNARPRESIEVRALAFF